MTSLLAQLPYQALVLLGSALVTVFKSIAFVQEGQRGVKLRFGKAVRYRTGKNAGHPKIVDPGFVFMIPFIDKLQRRHVRQETIRLDYQKIMFKDGMIFQVSAMLLFTVKDVFKAMFEIDNLDNAVETFGLAIIPAHSFQFMLTPEDQVACLACIRRHLDPGGLLVVHLDHLEVDWLGDLHGGMGGVFEPQPEVRHPRTGRPVRTLRAWTYEPSTQTASVVTVTEELDARGQVVKRRERGPLAQHCVFRFEMEHLLARAGFQVEAVYGDFYRGELQDDSSEMIWLARVP